MKMHEISHPQGEYVESSWGPLLFKLKKEKEEEDKEEKGEGEEKDPPKEE